MPGVLVAFLLMQPLKPSHRILAQRHKRRLPDDDASWSTRWRRGGVEEEEETGFSSRPSSGARSSR